MYILIVFFLSRFVVETVINVPTIELNDSKLDEQSTDGTEQIDDEENLLQNSDKSDAVFIMKSRNEEEHHLMLHSPVYQKTVESLPKKTNHTTYAIGSIRSLNSFGKVSTVKCRTILWYLSFVGFMVNYLFRLNVNIAIVEMVVRKTSATSNYHPSECVLTFNQTINSSTVKVNDVCSRLWNAHPNELFWKKFSLEDFFFLIIQFSIDSGWLFNEIRMGWIGSESCVGFILLAPLGTSDTRWSVSTALWDQSNFWFIEFCVMLSVLFHSDCRQFPC